MSTHRNCLAALLFVLALVPGLVSAQAYPSRPIHFIVPFGPGTSTDLQARFLANALSKSLGQAVVIDNKPGAAGIVGTQYAMGLPADGYSFTVGGTTSHAANVSLYKALPYDPVKDFIPVSGVAIGGGVFVVSPSFPAKNINELMNLARQQPGKYTYGWASAFSRVAFASLLHQSGLKMLEVPYKGGSSLSTEVMSGTVHMAFEPIVTLQPLIKSGKLRALGVSTQRRAPGLEDVPTIAEQGIRDYEFLGWLCLFARAGTSPEIITRINTAVNAILKTQTAMDFFRQNAGWEPMVMTPAETQKFVAKEIELWREGAKRAGIQPE